MIDKAISFFSQQWQFFLMIFVGLFALARGVRYIEDAAVRREENENLKNMINRMKKDRDYINDYKEEINNINRPDLLERMRKHGELIQH